MSFASNAWGTPVTVTGTDANDAAPAAIRDADGTVYLVSQRPVTDAGNEIVLRRRNAVTGDWTQPQRLSPNPANDQRPFPVSSSPVRGSGWPGRATGPGTPTSTPNASSRSSEGAVICHSHRSPQSVAKSFEMNASKAFIAALHGPAERLRQPVGRHRVRSGSRRPDPRAHTHRRRRRSTCSPSHPAPVRRSPVTPSPWGPSPRPTWAGSPCTCNIADSRALGDLGATVAAARQSQRRHQVESGLHRRQHHGDVPGLRPAGRGDCAAGNGAMLEQEPFKLVAAPAGRGRCAHGGGHAARRSDARLPVQPHRRDRDEPAARLLQHAGLHADPARRLSGHAGQPGRLDLVRRDRTGQHSVPGECQQPGADHHHDPGSAHRAGARPVVQHVHRGPLDQRDHGQPDADQPHRRRSRGRQRQRPDRHRHLHRRAQLACSAAVEPRAYAAPTDLAAGGEGRRQQARFRRAAGGDADRRRPDRRPGPAGDGGARWTPESSPSCC